MDTLNYQNENLEFGRLLKKDIYEFLDIAKALSTEIRIEILKLIIKSPMNITEIAEHFNLPLSTVASNIKKLEEAGIIRTDVVPGSHGSKKICTLVFSGIFLDFLGSSSNASKTIENISMPIGQFTDCLIEPTCGMLSSEKIIGEFDIPSSFFIPERINAQLIWFRQGYLEYKFPNTIKDFTQIKQVELSMEVCSEAPLYNLNWPSDLTVWINDIEIGTWTCPSDFGGERGILTPNWWNENNTQYGVYKTWGVNQNCTFVDGYKYSDTTIRDVFNNDKPYITVRVGVKKDAVNAGGINIFGKSFGNYETDLLLSIIRL